MKSIRGSGQWQYYLLALRGAYVLRSSPHAVQSGPPGVFRSSPHAVQRKNATSTRHHHPRRQNIHEWRGPHPGTTNKDLELPTSASRPPLVCSACPPTRKLQSRRPARIQLNTSAICDTLGSGHSQRGSQKSTNNTQVTLTKRAVGCYPNRPERGQSRRTNRPCVPLPPCSNLRAVRLHGVMPVEPCAVPPQANTSYAMIIASTLKLAHGAATTRPAHPKRGHHPNWEVGVCRSRITPNWSPNNPIRHQINIQDTIPIRLLSIASTIEFNNWRIKGI